MQSTQKQVTDTVTTATTPVVATAVTSAVASAVTAARTLRCAAWYLARYGWIQGAYYDQSATVFTPAACVVGAIAVVCYGGPVETPTQHFEAPGFTEFEAAITFLDCYLVDREGVTAYGFNDAKGRTVQDVRRALNEAADEWDRLYGGAA